jgi:eukaryotic-like serine/threonine-protein kinase
MPLTPGDRIGPYEVIASLGSGGMGEVVKAHDSRLGRDVAIKVLHGDMTTDETRKQRFIQEARAASALNHPNIITIYEINQERGMDYLVMECVDGKTLDQLIPEGGMTVEAIQRIAVQLADALAKAHAAGIVHRDLKPGNVMVTADGAVKVLDFGLAKLSPLISTDTMATVSVETSTPHTQAGMIVGTLSYMSPEQAQGRLVDGRSDIFSLGAMMYEMASGKLPFQSDSGIGLLAAILRDEPAPLANALDPIIRRCLRKAPADRFQTAADLRAALGGAERYSALTPAVATLPSLGVLPMVNLNRDEENDFLADGITEDLINALTQLKGLRVAARSAAFQLKGQSLSARDAGLKLGVGAVLEGTLRRAGKRLRVTVQLVDATDGFPLWSERYDRIVEDIFDIQDEISRAIVAKLEVEFAGSAETPIVRRSTGDVAAYQLYLQGRFHWAKRNPDAVAKAMVCYLRALELDPDYALAHSGLADCYTVLAFYGLYPPEEIGPKAMEAARRALELDEGLAEAHASLGFVMACYDWDWAGAEREMRRALELNPKVPVIHLWHAWILMIVGRPEEALENARAGRALDPVTAVLTYGVGSCLATLGRFSEALEELRLALDLDPTHVLTNFVLGMVLGLSGASGEAIAAFERISIPAWRLGGKGWFFGRQGRREEALALLDELQALSQTSHVPRLWMATVWLGLGDLDQAVALLDEDCAHHDALLCLFMPLPYFEPLRSHPRFRILRQRMGLAG